MKRFVFILLVFAVFAAGFAGAGHASLPDVDCAHYKSFVDTPDDDGCADGSSGPHFCDCCCHHVHAVTAPVGSVAAAGPVVRRVRPLLTAGLSGRGADSLYRPPIG